MLPLPQDRLAHETEIAEALRRQLPNQGAQVIRQNPGTACTGCLTAIAGLVSGIALLVIMIQGASGKIPSPKMGQLTLGFGALALGTQLTTIYGARKAQKALGIEMMSCTQKTLTLIGLLLSVSYVAFGALNLTGTLTARQVGYAMIAPIVLGPILQIIAAKTAQADQQLVATNLTRRFAARAEAQFRKMVAGGQMTPEQCEATIAIMRDTINQKRAQLGQAPLTF